MDFLSFVRSVVPAPPGRVLELGCGPGGGLGPALAEGGYAVLAVDPAAPAGPFFRQVRFEELEDDGPFDAVVASYSLHHVHDLGATLDRIAAVLAEDGVLVLDEFGWERLDEPTAEWYHGQLLALAAARGGEAPGSLAQTRERWRRDHEGLHTAEAMRRELAARFEERHFAWELHLHRELGGPATEALERTLVEAGAIRALGFRYAGLRAA